MDVINAIRLRRSIRRFQDRPIDSSILKELVNVGRLYASGANLQPIRFALLSQKALREQVNACFRWAGYLPDFSIAEDQHPQAFILLLGDASIRKDFDFDAGAAATNIMLAAEGYGLASCCLGVANRDRLSKLLALPDAMVPLYGIALGYAAHASHAVPLADSLRYWQDDKGDLCVPKRSPEDIIIFSDIS